MMRTTGPATIWQYPGALPTLAFMVALLACFTPACVRPASRDPLIDEYKRAKCIPLATIPIVRPHTRQWDTELTFSRGLQVIVKAMQSPGGRVTVLYPKAGMASVAADPGDYIYPSDIRADYPNDLLFVRARGLAGGMSEQTWLFEYDVRRKKVIKKLRVENQVLSQECPDS